ncbi:hypothetical protein PoB_001767000 [Plakobranchus ocellatus]|uniref:Uncharacterized protein n=1 Tax=Plakobranchus ocellatus TaxID=259542 RepID=A0AAV3Z9F3_9GAST|nr:hypothetical protein PoB_001767000 [Plakobranchus ocellatus]
MKSFVSCAKKLDIDGKDLRVMEILVGIKLIPQESRENTTISYPSKEIFKQTYLATSKSKMEKKEGDKKKTSKGVAYVTNGKCENTKKTSGGLADPEMTAPGDDVGSEDLPHKRSRCARYRCLFLLIGLIIGLAAIACIAYFLVMVLTDKGSDDPGTNADPINDERRGPLNDGQDRETTSTTQTPATEKKPDLSNIDRASLMRSVRGIPRDSLGIPPKSFRGIPRDSLGFRGIPSKGFRRIPRDSKGFQEIPRDS